MQLLSPQEKKDELAEEERRKRGKLEELNAAIDEKIKKFNDLKDNTAEAERVLIRTHKEFREKLQVDKTSLEKEVCDLELRKKTALIPISEEIRNLECKKIELDERESKLLKKEEDFAIKRHEVDELADKYEERLGELTDLQAEVQEREKHLGEKEAHFNHMMRYRESKLQKERDRIRQLFEEYDSRIKNNK